MMKKTLLVSVGAAALLSMAACSTTNNAPADKPVEAAPAAAPADGAAAPAADAAKAPEGSCGGEKKAGEGSCGGAPKN